MANKRGGMIGIATMPLTSRVDTNPLADAGTKFWAGQTLLEYTQYTQGPGTIAITAGDCLYYTENDQQKVTPDVSAALNSGVNACAGVAGYAVVVGDSGKYILIMKRGPSEYPPGTDISLNTGDIAITQGDAARANAPGDGQCGLTAENTAPQNQIIGWFLTGANGKANLVL